MSTNTDLELFANADVYNAIGGRKYTNKSGKTKATKDTKGAKSTKSAKDSKGIKDAKKSPPKSQKASSASKPKKQSGGNFDLSSVADLAVPFALLWSTKAIDMLPEMKVGKKQKGGAAKQTSSSKAKAVEKKDTKKDTKKMAKATKTKPQKGGSRFFSDLLSPSDLLKQASEMAANMSPIQSTEEESI